MKKTIIIYAILFALTLIIPAAVCFITNEKSESDDLINIFRQCITLIGCYR